MVMVKSSNIVLNHILAKGRSMYSNDSAVLGASTVAAPTALGIALWPDAALIILGLAFVAIGVMYLLFKRRSRLD